MVLNKKKILIISPSKWGDMYISKHHYSIELAKLGNEVIYLEPAVIGKFGDISFSNPRKDIDNLKIATPKMPKWMEILRFKFRNIYDFFCKFYIDKLVKSLEKEFDIVWCFETNLYSNLRRFQAKLVIYHPVDIGVYEYQQKIAATSDITFTVSDSLAKDFIKYNKNTFFINHGLSEDFAILAKKSLKQLQDSLKEVEANSEKKISIGFVGNLFRTELNREFISQIVKQYSQIEFHIWGPIEHSSSNVDGLLTKETLGFVDFLKKSNNVKLHGVKRGNELAEDLKTRDILLLALNHSMMYDGSNSHKIMEYLSTGNAVVSHHVGAYSGLGLLQMGEDSSTEELLNTFKDTLNNLDTVNNLENKIRRIQFGLDNTYLKQIMRIEEKINQLQFSENK